MIKIKCGTCGTSQGYKTAADGYISLPVAEEARLVARNVAEYMTEPIIGDFRVVAMPAGGLESARAGVNPPDDEKSVGGTKNEPPKNIHSSAEDPMDGNGEDTGYAEGEYIDVSSELMQMSFNDLKAMAKELGVSIGKKNKEAIVGAICETLANADEPPTITAAEPE